MCNFKPEILNSSATEVEIQSGSGIIFIAIDRAYCLEKGADSVCSKQ